ncbi:MAG TPA: hypothetical protein VH370_26690 [Humisphaera sp.]|jgi:Arc/MetJ-type ribon-helix-helix transcriptional regulator|nr:hypothetical protein [Humisphaera sp.]
MAILSPDTEKLIADRLQQGGYKSADELVRVAIETLDQMQTQEIDPDTLDAIEEAEAQYARGEGRPWEEVREELRAKYVKE